MMDKQKDIKIMVVGPDFEKVEEFLKKKFETKIAKTKIKTYFEERHGESIGYLDLIDDLEIPLPLIVEARSELEKENKIVEN